MKKKDEAKKKIYYVLSKLLIIYLLRGIHIVLKIKVKITTTTKKYYIICAKGTVKVFEQKKKEMKCSNEWRRMEKNRVCSRRKMNKYNHDVKAMKLP